MIEQLKRFELPGRVQILEGNGGLPKIAVTPDTSAAEVYLHGAHVTAFGRHGEAPLLFMSGSSRFAPGQPIRGGVPLIFPWFGARDGEAAHGFARTAAWELTETALIGDGVVLKFRLPAVAEAAPWPAFTAEYTVTIAGSLTLELTVTHTAASGVLEFENCLHTYFTVGDINAVTVRGLQGVEYLDKVDGFARKTEVRDGIRIGGEVDRVYLGTTGAVEIIDTALGRRIVVEKSGSASTVLWNPWIAKARQMADFGDDEYQRMICVESGNVAANRLTLGPGQSNTLRVQLSSQPA